MKLKAVEPNPDGLDEVFEAYQTLRLVLEHAVLVPKPSFADEEEAARAFVEEALDMLEAWLVQECNKRGAS